MNTLQTTIIAALSIAAAAGILMFRREGHTHKPAVSLLAWAMFCQMGGLALAAMIRADGLVQWFLIGGLAVHTLNILLAKGNINRVRPQLDALSPRRVGPRRAAKTKPAHRNTKVKKHA